MSSSFQSFLEAQTTLLNGPFSGPGSAENHSGKKEREAKIRQEAGHVEELLTMN